MTQLGCRLMVGQEILVLFIMVRIRAPQPIFKRPAWGVLILALLRPFDLKHRPPLA